MGVDTASLMAGLAIPVATFTGLWFWRLRPSRQGDRQDETPSSEAALAESVVGVHARLNDLQRQMTELGQDWEERDRQLAERISGLIDISAKAAGPGPQVTRQASGPWGTGEDRRGGASEAY
jgi:hypothetical protein